MKISEFISVLSDVKKHYGDYHIWSMESDSFPNPRNIEMDITKTIKQTNFGFKGGKASETKEIEIHIEYEGVKYVDRCIDDRF